MQSDDERLLQALDSLSFTEKEYKLYGSRFDSLTEETVQELRTEHRSLQDALARNTTKTKQITRGRLPQLNPGARAYGLAQNDLAELQTEYNNIEERLK